MNTQAEWFKLANTAGNDEGVIGVCSSKDLLESNQGLGIHAWYQAKGASLVVLDGILHANPSQQACLSQGLSFYSSYKRVFVDNSKEAVLLGRADEDLLEGMDLGWFESMEKEEGKEGYKGRGSGTNTHVAMQVVSDLDVYKVCFTSSTLINLQNI